MRRNTTGSLQSIDSGRIWTQGKKPCYSRGGSDYSISQRDSTRFSKSCSRGFRSYSLNEFMTLDASTRRNLELEETLRGEYKGSLLGVLDCAVTPMGKRMMHQWVSQPLLNIEKIKARQDGVQYFFDDGMKRAKTRAIFKTIGRFGKIGQSRVGRSRPTTRPSCNEEHVKRITQDS